MINTTINLRNSYDYGVPSLKPEVVTIVAWTFGDNPVNVKLILYFGFENEDKVVTSWDIVGDTSNFSDLRTDIINGLEKQDYKISEEI